MSAFVKACLLNPRLSSSTSSPLSCALEVCLSSLISPTGEVSSGETVVIPHIKTQVNVQLFSILSDTFGVLCLLTCGLLVSLILWRQLAEKCPDNLPYVVNCMLLLSIRVLDGSGVECVVLDLGWTTQLVSESSKRSSIKSSCNFLVPGSLPLMH